MSTGSKLIVKILTPVGSVLQEEASIVLLPGVKGELGVLPGHVSTIFKMDPGVVKVVATGKTESLFIFGGFAKVHDNELYVIVDKACRIDELDALEAKKNLDVFEQELLSLEDLNMIALTESKAHLARKIIEVSTSKH